MFIQTREEVLLKVYLLSSCLFAMMTDVFFTSTMLIGTDSQLTLKSSKETKQKQDSI